MNPPLAGNWKKNPLPLGVVVLLIAVHVGFGIHAAIRLSVTNDEFWHIPVGYWNVTTGRFHYDNLNPPLARSLCAVPLVLAGAKPGEVADNAAKETRADAFVAANRNRYETLLVLARAVTLLLSAATAWLLADWALRLFGPGASMLAAALWCLSPNVIAHASLATTDMAAALFFVAVIRAAWMFGSRTGWRWAILLGLLLGLAQLAKFTCLLLVPLAVVTWGLRCRSESSRDVNQASNITIPPLSHSMKLWTGAAVVCLIVINAGYLFRGTGQSFAAYQFGSQSLRSIRDAMGPLSNLPVPLPVDYVEGIDRQRLMMESSHPTYLDNQIRFEGGFRDYFVKAAWYKIPHATQFLCGFGFAGLLCGTGSGRFRLHFALLTPVVLLFVIASYSNMQLGIRYVLPVFPLLFLSVSHVASTGLRKIGIRQVVCVAAIIGVGCALRFSPFHLSYFNELAGGPENGESHLLDSNVDWGQGLYELRKYAADNGIPQVQLAYFGAINPAALGVRFEVAQHAEHPQVLFPKLKPGVYAVSKNFTNGRPGMVRDPDGTTRAIGPYEYGFFRKCFERDGQVGYCLDIYNLSAADIALMPPNPE